MYVDIWTISTNDIIWRIDDMFELFYQFYMELSKRWIRPENAEVGVEYVKEYLGEAIGVKLGMNFSQGSNFYIW